MNEPGAPGFAVVKMIPMASPALAVGIMILALCPGGTTSNLMSYLAKGDVALSISLTAIVSLITPFTIPFLAVLAMEHLMGAGQIIELPIAKTVVVLFAITVVPVGLGMGVRKGVGSHGPQSREARKSSFGSFPLRYYRRSA